MSSSSIPPKMAAAGNQLALEVATGEVVSAMAASGVETIVLKGPSVARWLYERPWARVTSDCDLLVSSAELARAERVLGELGFVKESFSELEGDRPLLSHPWYRAGPNNSITVDLHHGLPGAGTQGERFWEVISEFTEPMSLRGTKVEVLAPAALAAHLALHAAQHGGGRPVVDLVRALEQQPEELWVGAAEVAAPDRCNGRVRRGSVVGRRGP